MDMTNNNRDALLKKIQAEDFALYETVLYLDGHPRDKKALEFYCQRRDALAALKEEFRKKFGPLTIYDNNDNDSWHWIDKPWPWEKEAN